MYNATFVCSLQHYLNMYVFERFSLQLSKTKFITFELGSYMSKQLSNVYFTGF